MKEHDEYITAFCRKCRKRIKHKLVWRGLIPILRYAKCMACGNEWRYRNG